MSHLTDGHLQKLSREYGELKLLDDVIRHRAADNPERPILGYPQSEDSADDYECFTGKQLDRFINAAARNFISFGLQPNERGTVALLASSNVDFLVSLFALSRLGYTVLCLSLRITPVAIENLLLQTDCRTIVHGGTLQIESMVKTLSQKQTLTWVPIPCRNVYDRVISSENEDSLALRNLDRDEESGRIALIMHSSGSTGLPKPVMLSHRAILAHAMQGTGTDNFGAHPFYHVYGISTTLQAMYMGKIPYIYSAALPLTAENLVSALAAVKPGAVHTVPYTLGLMTETPEGLDCLRSCQHVTAGGARIPEELGDRLVRQGVNFAVVYGSTEAGLTGDSMRREPGDDSWEYIRIYPYHRKFVYMDPIGDNQYEAVYLKGHPGLSASNSDEPAPGSWRSKDIFVSHPTIPDVWKYVTRLDDRVTLMNGEKVLPLPMEGRIRQNALIREAVVFGIDKPVPGLLVFRARNAEADEMSEQSYIDAIWPSVSAANQHAEAFSQIAREMIVLVDPDVGYSRTDKGNIIRAQVYAQFGVQIEDAYKKLDVHQEGGLDLDAPAIEELIMATFRDTIGVTLPSAEADFFMAGVDSLKAIQMRNIIQKRLNLNGAVLALNVVYERRNTKLLAKYLHSLGKDAAGDSSGDDCETVEAGSLMRQLVSKYSFFAQTAALLTGATGSLGAHTLARLARDPQTRRIYCLVRSATTGRDPMGRILDSLKDRGIKLDDTELAKIVGLEADLAQPNFGLDDSTVQSLQADVSLVVHSAWAVNFNISLQSFEQDIAGLQNLIRFSMSVRRPEPALLLFCSSISTATNTPGRGTIAIPDGPIKDSKHSANMGYAQSKWVGEHVVLNAARAGARSYVLRIGQIVGDADSGIWNDKEAIPALIRSALSLGALPDLPRRCSWLPVDTAASIIVELSQKLSLPPYGRRSNPFVNSIFYNLVNPASFMWRDMLAELRTLGLEFRTVPMRDWLQLLRESAACGDENIEQTNPAVKLLDHFNEEYGQDDKADIVFETAAVCRDASMALRSPPQIIEDGYLKKFVADWMRRWKA